MKRTAFLLPWIFSFMLVSCYTRELPEMLDNSYCGFSNTWSVYPAGGDQLTDTANGFNTYMEGNLRVFNWGKVVDQICTQKKSYVYFNATVTNKDSASLTSVRARVSWLSIYDHVVAIPYHNLTGIYEGSDSLDLSLGFDDSPAWCKPTIEVFFPTKGSYASDVAYLKTRINGIHAGLSYRNHHN